MYLFIMNSSDIYYLCCFSGMISSYLERTLSCVYFTLIENKKAGHAGTLN